MTSGFRVLLSTVKASRSRIMMYTTVNQVYMNAIPARIENNYPYIGLGMTSLLNHRLYSSSVGGMSSGASKSDLGASNNGENVMCSGANGLMHKVKEVWDSGVIFVSQTREKVKDVLGEANPRVEQLFETNPYLCDVILPVSGTVVGTIAAWFIVPTFCRRLHKVLGQGSSSLLPATGSLRGAVPYEKSIWAALEVPVKYLITFMAFSQIGAMVAPTTIALQYVGPAWRAAWRAAVILSFVWFLYRWKTNVVSRALLVKLNGVDCHKLLALDKFYSVGLFVFSGLVLAEACGVAAQPAWSVGGIATAFAARDLIGNVLSGQYIRLLQAFSIGDTIVAEAVEGKVVEMGLTATSLLSVEKSLVVVPNLLFSNQAIVNKSRVESRPVVSKIPVQIDDFDKIPQISKEITNMMKANANVFLEKEQPYCYLSRVERSFAELSLGYNLKQMSEDNLFSAEEDLILQSVEIVKKHGGMLPRTWKT